jgi:hypothetical protein
LGKQSRRSRRERESFLAAHPRQAAVAEVVDEAWRRWWDAWMADIVAITQRFRLDAGEATIVRGVQLSTADLHRARAARRHEGGDWPAYSYFPMTLAAPVIVHGCRWPTDDATISRCTASLDCVGGLGGWAAAPLVATFDAELADAVMATPITGEIPFDALRHLPGWTVAIPLPWLTPTAVAFVWIDAGTVTHPRVATSRNMTIRTT